MYEELQEIARRPDVFGVYTADSLWTDAYRSRRMLAFHLDENLDVSSRNHRFIERSARWISSAFAVGPGSRVCDFGCGPGLYTRRLAETGARVSGVDFSRNSVAYAKSEAARRGLDIDYIEADYLDVDLRGPFDLVTMIMCDFCALGPAQRKTLLEKFASLLAPHGNILLDVYSINTFRNREESAVYGKNHLDHFWYEEDYYCFANVFKYEEEKVILDKYTLFPASGKREVFYNWVQCYDPASLDRELAGTGLRIRSVFADVCGNAYDPGADEFAVVVGKTGGSRQDRTGGRR